MLFRAVSQVRGGVGKNLAELWLKKCGASIVYFDCYIWSGDVDVSVQIDIYWVELLSVIEIEACTVLFYRLLASNIKFEFFHLILTSVRSC